MEDVFVEPAGTGDPQVFAVTVGRGPGCTHHLVTVPAQEAGRFGELVDSSDLVRASFEFLLEREAKESILGEFVIGVIRRYFPEWDSEMTRRFCGNP